jgi:hypothetical protein
MFVFVLTTLSHGERGLGDKQSKTTRSLALWERVVNYQPDAKHNPG